MGDRWFSLGMLLLGVLLGVVVPEIVKAIYVVADVRAHLLSLHFSDDRVGLEIALVNNGNRQAAITSMRLVLLPPGSELQINEHLFEVKGLPTVLNPNDIKIATVTGPLAADLMFVNLSARKTGAVASEEQEMPFGLSIRSLDFKGRKFQSLWRIGRLALTPQRVWGMTTDNDGEEFRLFDKMAQSIAPWLITPSVSPARDANQ